MRGAYCGFVVTCAGVWAGQEVASLSSLPGTTEEADCGGNSVSVIAERAAGDVTWEHYKWLPGLPLLQQMDPPVTGTLVTCELPCKTDHMLLPGRQTPKGSTELLLPAFVIPKAPVILVTSPVLGRVRRGRIQEYFCIGAATTQNKQIVFS